MNVQEQLKRLSQTISQVSPARAHAMQQSGAALVDVRETEEHVQGLADGAIPIVRNNLPRDIEQAVPQRERTVLLLCAHGQRSLLAAETLRQMGYQDLHSVAGGFVDWQQQGLPWSVPDTNDPAASERYARQVQLPEIGLAGQRKLAAARVLLVGAGGLGSPAALYLAGAGIGTLGLVDADHVERSNLHRQVVHSEERLGQLKTESARTALAALNPEIAIPLHSERLTRNNVERIFAGYDLILDGSDNFATRYLVNDACQKLGLVNISAAVQGFEGQLAVFAPGGPCYRCLFPSPPAAENAPNCNAAGVLGIVPGIMGLYQALEATKIIAEFGDTLTGKLLIYNAMTARQRTLKLSRDPQCAYCDPQTPFPGYIDYSEFCGAQA